MKTRIILFITILLSVLSSCKDADELQNVIYFTGTENSPVLKMSIEEPTDLGVSVRASSITENDINITVSVNESLIEKYNKENGTNYKALAADVYSLSSTDLQIKAGKFVSEPVKLSIKTLDSFTDEDIYCVPIEIKNVQGGDFPVLEASRVMYLVINRTIITKAADLSGNYFKVDFDNKDLGKGDLSAVDALTMEARIYVDRFQTSSPYISTIIGLEENFLLRIGDVTIDNSQLQLAGGGYPVTSVNRLSANVWTHIAVTYDGSMIRLYINGELESYVEAPRGPINLTGLDADRKFYIGQTPLYGRYLYGKISEARVWTRALTKEEIQNGICAVSPASEGLLAYWKFNSAKSETELNIIPDLTGNGYHAKGVRNVSWVEGVRCP
ncbi:DUF1735 and LamG domain-containing protein [Dysgonomonas sp. Marseille-P4677]|uniref:DUF1735 and LamG domain-containing protein n=1 Tax=Dysgonomonas sp. Marseille-P4677 TaxID=2364790 RepID=UPI0019112E28|nr:DUF1735 and LamG domain-containing protein [Dysgonomonas sp. Marseille-P4677]MBK5722745.1 DUF1735 and LamG domain-containing protein [Dysgonomonas sp. Marseille-P4677]